MKLVWDNYLIITLVRYLTMVIAHSFTQLFVLIWRKLVNTRSK